MLIKTPLDAEQRFPCTKIEPCWRSRLALTRITGKWTDLMNHNWQFILQLNAIAETVVQINIRHGVRAFPRTTLAQPPKVDLPMLVARRLRVIGPEGWPTLRASNTAK